MKPKVPAWGIIVGVALLVFGLFGMISDAQSLFIDDIFSFQQDIMDQSFEQLEEDPFEEFDQEWQDMIDSLEVKEAQWEELDALEEQLEQDALEGDSSLVPTIDSLKTILGGEDGFDEYDRVDMTEFQRESLRKVGNMPKAFSDMFSISDHTKKWTERFAWIGILVNIGFIVIGIFLLVMKKMAPNLAMALLTASILLAVARIMVITGDADTGFFAKTSWIGDAWSIFLDLGLLITLFVVDKSPYTGKLPARAPQPAPTVKGDGEDF